MNSFSETIDQILVHLYSHMKQNRFAGWDPYDGLRSAIFQKSPFFRFRFCRLAWIQLFKRSPVNLRRVFRVPGDTNSKGLALLIRGLLCRAPGDRGKRTAEYAVTLGERILARRSPDREYFCAGYPFYWEARAFSVPPEAPNLVVSVFAAEAFLDLFNRYGENRWLQAAKEVAFFLEKELILDDAGPGICFGYIPGERIRVHNVNLLGAALFGRLYSLTGEEVYQRHAMRAAEYSVSRQLKSGAWYYGEAPWHRWVDNFHTGFILTALNRLRMDLDTRQWEDVLHQGLAYHLENHFTGAMVPRYYSHRKYPVDIHNYAQGILTCLEFDRKPSALRLAENAVRDFWNPSKGYFYYQKTPFFTNRINYFRWSQTWMFYALSKLAAGRGERE